MDNFVISIFILLVLSLAELRKTCEDHGLSPLVMEEECKETVQFLGIPYEKREIKRDHPRGCYVSVINGNINKGYLNDHEKGRGNRQARAICKGSHPSSTVNHDSYNYNQYL